MRERQGGNSVGIIGGLGVRASADILGKLRRLAAAAGGHDMEDGIVFESRPFEQKNDVCGRPAPDPGDAQADPNARKLYCFDVIRQFEQRRLGAAMLPCFISHTFIDELQAETSLTILNLMTALLEHLRRTYPDLVTIGVLTSDYVRENGLFERCLGAHGYRLIYPDDDALQAGVMRAVYGPAGLKNAAPDPASAAVDDLARACANLLERGAELCLPGITEIAIVAEALRARGIPLLDASAIYAGFALAFEGAPRPRQLKVGVIGGVGPAATVDFINKIIVNTPASRDQDHIKLVVEHNPQIPDRTANLIGDGADPTVALYAACKRLADDDADLIAIPCNTAHAYVERIQAALAIPIVHMLFETVEYALRHCADKTRIGLLATSGTLQSRVYHEVIGKTHFELLTPDPFHQELVMRAIYGPVGVKAGFSAGQCRSDLLAAMAYLVRKGADILILGCTELPLLVAQDPHFMIGGRAVVVLDPTEILARRCVALARP